MLLWVRETHNGRKTHDGEDSTQASKKSQTPSQFYKKPQYFD
jgi:hypothetical protein